MFALHSKKSKKTHYQSGLGCGLKAHSALRESIFFSIDSLLRLDQKEILNYTETTLKDLPYSSRTNFMKAEKKFSKGTELGIDLGTTSLGWTLLETIEDEPKAIVDMGVRIFEAGVDGKIEYGQDSSKAAVRRGYRQSRRQTFRRQTRQKLVFNLLSSNGLLPPSANNTAKERVRVIAEVDRVLREEIPSPTRRPHIYLVRAAATNRKISLWGIGRAIYHLNQRRGFKSGLRGLTPKEDEGKVKQAISDLAIALNGRTLGEYFATLDPENWEIRHVTDEEKPEQSYDEYHKDRIRVRWTSREMVENEFNKLWDTQAPFHPELTDDLRKQLHKAIFYQRPLRSAKELVGWCTLESDQRRAALALPIAQRFRILQKINDLTIQTETSERMLNQKERTVLLDRLTKTDGMTFSQIRKLLGLPKKAKFNFEIQRGDDKKESRLIGHKTNALMSSAFGDRWFELSDHEQEKIVYEVLAYRKPEKLKERAIRVWSLSPSEAYSLTQISLDAKYCNLSKVALRKVLPLMEKGLSFASAKTEVYPDNLKVEKYDFLPPVTKVIKDLTNHAVIRALTELRKVVNAIIRQYGCPTRIRVELSRDLKRSKKERQNIHRKMKHREDLRNKAFDLIKEEYPNYKSAKGNDLLIEKILLAEECNWTCPYTGKQITLKTLIGSDPQFDIEHIFPRKYLDNSFANKTLCWHHENRNRKGNQTPYEAYGSDPARWAAILARVSKFKNLNKMPSSTKKAKKSSKPKKDEASIHPKYYRFTTEHIEQDFTSRHLNDTRYASRLATNYLRFLYGGLFDQKGQRIFTLTGKVTSLIRGQLGLNHILGDSGAKNREDHRHHAIDSLVIALSNRSIVRQLETTATLGKTQNMLDAPWKTFQDDVKSKVKDIVVSHRLSRKVKGPLHDDTVYGVVRQEGQKQYCHVTKSISALSKSEILDDSIVNTYIRSLVRSQYDKLAPKFKDGLPSKVFADPLNHPTRTHSDGRVVPIHRVTIKRVGTYKQIGSKSSKLEKRVRPNGLFGTFVLISPNGKSAKFVPIYRLDAAKFIDKSNKRLTTRDLLDMVLGAHAKDFRDWQLRCHLLPNDCIEADDTDGSRVIFRVLSASQTNIMVGYHCDARPSHSMRIARSSKWFIDANAVKVVICPMGKISYA